VGPDFINALQALDRLLQAIHAAQSEDAPRGDRDRLHVGTSGSRQAEEAE
jgi:hypothetical protein